MPPRVNYMTSNVRAELPVEAARKLGEFHPLNTSETLG